MIIRLDEEWSTYKKLLFLKAVGGSGANEYEIEGNPVSFATNVAKPLTGFTIPFLPVQDLHGYDSPWSAGGGKNKYNAETKTSGQALNTSNGGTYNNANWEVSDFIPAGNGDITLAWDSETNYYQANFCAYDANKNFIAESGVAFSEYGYTHTFTAPAETAFVRFSWAFVVSGTEYPRTNVRVCIGASDLGFAPYSNICPISGRTGITAWRTGRNKLPNNATNESKTINDVTITSEDGVYSFSGISTGAISVVIPLSASVDISPSTSKIAFLNNKAVNVSVGFHRSGHGQIHFWSMNYVNRVGSGWTDTGNEVVDGIQISISSGVDTTGLVVSPMLVLLADTNPTTFEPYTGESYPVTFPAVGKNLGNFVDGYGVATDGTIVQSATRCATVEPIAIDQSKSYVVSGQGTGKEFIYSVWNRETLVRRVASQPSGSVLDVSGGTHLYVCMYENVTVEDNKPQVEIGSTPSAYEPFTNTVYGGTLDAVNGVLTVDRVMVTFDGTQPDSQFSLSEYPNSNPFRNRISWAGIYAADGGKVGGKYISDTLTGDTEYDNVPQIWHVANSSALYARMFIGVPPTITSVAEWQAYVTQNPISVIYELATPIEIPLDPITVQTLIGDNVIWTDTNGENTIRYKKKG